jgi:serine/threonine protein phosphatase PrpC
MKTAAALRSGVATHPGRQRTNNEDRVYADDVNGIFLVVDGLGGHAAGETAAQTAVDVIVRELDPPGGRIEEQVRRAITLANNEIYRHAQSNPDSSGMACVLTLAVAHDDVVTVGHVGDSRLYLLWNGAARKLTSDHSPVGEQEDQGELTETEAMAHPHRNQVFRDVGSRMHSPDDEYFIDVKSFPLHAAAALLLCSDGLSDALTSFEIAEILETYDGDSERVAQLLIEAANERGGNDNVSVIFVPGPEFIGVNSPRMAGARSRHAVTRMRRRRSAWKRAAVRALWVIIGVVLGMMLWAYIEKRLPHPAAPVSTPVRVPISVSIPQLEDPV